MTTINKALKKLQEDSGEAVSEKTEVRLLCQTPPISKLDNSLNNLTACEKLSLSARCSTHSRRAPLFIYTLLLARKAHAGLLGR